MGGAGCAEEGGESMTLFNVFLPFPDPALSPNASERHWREKQPAKVSARESAQLLTRNAVAKSDWRPRKGRLATRITFYMPDRRRRDLDNLFAALKPAIDGMCAELGIDDCQLRPVTLDDALADRDDAGVHIQIGVER